LFSARGRASVRAFSNGGVCVDANDHIFVLSRANLYSGISEIAQAAPPVMEFDLSSRNTPATASRNPPS
jgi:hypothetical protein